MAPRVTFLGEVVLGAYHLFRYHMLALPSEFRKTTTMVFKMLGIERTWEQKREEFSGVIPRPRQMFVTQSRVLAEKVEEYYGKLSQSLAAEQRSSKESSQLAAEKEQMGMVDRDEEEVYHGKLPKRFGELEDKHFPLFLTYDQVTSGLFPPVTV